MQKLIEAAEVKRDEDGIWYHPDLPEFDEGQEKEYRAWIAAQGLERTWRSLEEENPDHPAYIKYFDEGDPDCSQWEPAAPAGEGWFLLAIGDTEDGPVATYVRRAAATTSTEGR